MLLPLPRGPLSTQVFDLLRTAPDIRPTTPPTSSPDDLVVGASPDDAAITLWMLHELHYRGFDDVDDRWEWAPR